MIVESPDLTTTAQVVDVTAGVTSPVTILLAEPAQKVLVVEVSRQTATTLNGAGLTRGQSFIKQLGKSGGNDQSLATILRSSPGLAGDSTGQIHPVGEHDAKSFIIDGFQVPDPIPGHQGDWVVPSVIKSINIMTGGFAPRYGRETAAILDVDLLDGQPKPEIDVAQTYGGYDTAEESLLASGQTGSRYGLPQANGEIARRLGYLIDFDVRSTANSQEPPQPSPQSAHNGQTATYFLGHLNYQLDPSTQMKFTVGTNPIKTQIANRTGLTSSFASIGQGYGFGGSQPASSGLHSQQQLGQDIYQTDYNEFGAASWQHDFGHHNNFTADFGMTHSALNINNNNPAVSLASLPADSSIEYNPTIIRNERNFEGSTSAAFHEGHHLLEFGFTLDHETGIDSYQLIPASQAALNNLLSGDPTVSTPDPSNPLYAFRPDGTTATTITVSRAGDYRAAYTQDTWQIAPKFAINYGVRWEQYIQNEVIQRNADAASNAKDSQSELEPRLNLIYKASKKYTFNASYNRLMTIPPTPQGLSLNNDQKNPATAPPEINNQCEAGTTVDLGRHQSLIMDYIYKQLTNQLDVGLLVPGAQIGSYAAASIPHDTIRAFEFGYNFSSGHPIGFDGYVSYQNATAKIQQDPSSPYFGQPYNDHDQLHTLEIGLDYSFRGGASAGITYSYGSGFASGILPNQSSRNPHQEVDLIGSVPLRIGRGGWKLGFSIVNLFNETTVYNFQSGFAGTRFQQGRTFSITLSAKF